MKLPNWICHQMPSRSFFINKKQMSLCSRCFGIYLGMFIGVLISILLNLEMLFNKNLMLFLAISLIFPIAIDGTTQMLKLRESNNPLRFFTGLLAGIFSGIGIHYLSNIYLLPT